MAEHWQRQEEFDSTDEATWDAASRQLHSRLASLSAALAERDEQITRLREALESAPIAFADAYAEAQNDGCDAVGAYDCGMAELSRHVGAALAAPPEAAQGDPK